MARTVKLYIYEDRLFHICMYYPNKLHLKSNYIFKSKDFVMCQRCRVKFRSFVTLGFESKKYEILMSKDDFNILIAEGKIKELKIEGGYF